MAYQNLTLRNIAGEITAQFNDGSFRSLTPPDPSSGETAAFIGTASSGVTHEFFQHVDLGRTFTEFGADSEIAKMVQSAKASDEALPVIVSRVGARNSSLSLKRNIANSEEKETLLRIIPKFVQEEDPGRGRVETLDALKVIMLPYTEGSLVRQRVILGLESASGVTVPVYDSERLVVADGEVIFDVEMNLPVGEVFYTALGLSANAKDASELNIGNPADGFSDVTTSQAERMEYLKLLNEVVSFEWSEAQYLSNASILDHVYLLEIYTPAQNSLTAKTGFTPHIIVGSSGKNLVNKSARYVGVDLAYQGLQFEDVGYIYCEGCHADTECVDIETIEGGTREQISWPLSKLGNLFKSEQDGQEYSYMFGRRDPFNASEVVGDYDQVFTVEPGVFASFTNQGILYTAKTAGVAANTNTFEITTAGAEGAPFDIELLGSVSDVTIKLTPSNLGGDDLATISQLQLLAALRGTAQNNITITETGFTIAQLQAEYRIVSNPAHAADGANVVALADSVISGHADHIAGTNQVNVTANFAFSAEHKALGDLLNLVEVHLDGSAANNTAARAVECFPNEKGMIECHLTFQSSQALTDTLTLETPFFSISFSADYTNPADGLATRLRPCEMGGAADRAISIAMVLQDKVRDGNGDFDKNDPFVMTHYDLTGQFVPEGVLGRLLEFSDVVVSGNDTATATSATLKATNSQVREVSFLQQAAQAAYAASTNYSQCIAVVPTSAPGNADRGLQRWAGQPASYEVNSQGELKVALDGSGILGMKLLAGRSDYRNGAAFGGIMLTNGNDLPDEKPYGIDDSDEARDAYGEAIDLGKHVVVVGAYGIVPDPEAVLNRRRANQTGGIFTNAGPKICGILNSLSPGNEPIGQVNGRVAGMTPRHSTTMSVLNNLALIRVCMIDQNGIISSIYTGAQPNSDYRKISSIMSSNAILKQLRAICMPYVGRPFKDEEIASLTQTIDGAMKQMVSQDFAQRINVSLSASRVDRINGVLRASVRFVPPLSIEAITVEITLEPPAAGL